MVTGALKATGNRGLQPAMDHILEHEGQPAPDLGSVNEQAGSSSAPMDVDEDDEDAEALKSLGVLKGNEVEAKVYASTSLPSEPLTLIPLLDTDIRVSNVPNAAKSSKTPHWPISMLRRVAMISSRSPRKR